MIFVAFESQSSPVIIHAMLVSDIFIATWCMVAKCMTVSATTIKWNFHRREVPPNPEVVRELDDDDPPPPLLHLPPLPLLLWFDELTASSMLCSLAVVSSLSSSGSGCR